MALGEHKRSIRVVRPLAREFTPAQQRELRKRYRQAQRQPISLEQLRNMPDPLDPNFGKDWRE